MRSKHGSWSLWAADDEDDTQTPAFAALSDTTAHFKGKPPPPPPPPPPPGNDPTPYWSDVDSGQLWTSSITSTQGDAQGNLTVTFSFPDAASDYGHGYSEAGKFVAFDSDERMSFRTVTAQVNSFLSGLNLTENIGSSDGAADSRIAKTITPGADAWAYYPALNKGGDAWFNRNDGGVPHGGMGGMNWDPAHLSPGDYTYTVFMHEFGHALGLKHSFENGGVGGTPLPKTFDTLEYTVMGYDAYQDPNDSSVDQRNWWADDGNNPQTYMMLDIAALQHMYGADYTSVKAHPGDTTYTWSDFPTTANGGVVFMTLWDGGGIDTYDFSGGPATVSVSIDLQPGHWVSFFQNGTPYERADLLAGTGTHWATGNIANALVYTGTGTDFANDDPNNPIPALAGHAGYIENAIGTSNDDVLIGNIKDNRLTGGAGSDTLTGNAGNDTFVFNSLDPLHWDTVTDFTPGSDKLEFDHLTFGKLTPVGGTLDSGELVYSTPTQLDDYLIYDSTGSLYGSAGALYYDADGSGLSSNRIEVAVLTGHPSLLSTDILVA